MEKQKDTPEEGASNWRAGAKPKCWVCGNLDWICQGIVLLSIHQYGEDRIIHQRFADTLAFAVSVAISYSMLIAIQQAYGRLQNSDPVPRTEAHSHAH
jgi:hypothetical protein